MLGHSLNFGKNYIYSIGYVAKNQYLYIYQLLQQSEYFKKIRHKKIGGRYAIFNSR